MQFSEYDKPWAAYTSLEQVLGGLINGGAHILKGLITGKEKAPIEATCIAELKLIQNFIKYLPRRDTLSELLIH